MATAMTSSQIEAIAPYIINHHNTLGMAPDEIAPVVGCTVEVVEQVINAHEAYLDRQIDLAIWFHNHNLSFS